jgi:hypothetical protein
VFQDIDQIHAAGFAGVGLDELKLPPGSDALAHEVMQAAGLTATYVTPAVWPIVSGPLDQPGQPIETPARVDAIETVHVDDLAVLTRLAEWMRARGKERREAIWFRDADAAQALDAALFAGLTNPYPPNYDCGACGYATCAEFLHATKQQRGASAELEFTGPTCTLRAVELGVAVGSAARTAQASASSSRGRAASSRSTPQTSASRWRAWERTTGGDDAATCSPKARARSRSLAFR